MKCVAIPDWWILEKCSRISYTHVGARPVTRPSGRRLGTVCRRKQIIKAKGICKQNFKRKKNQCLRAAHQKISSSLSIMSSLDFSSQWRTELQRQRANTWKIHIFQQPFRSNIKDQHWEDTQERFYMSEHLACSFKVLACQQHSPIFQCIHPATFASSPSNYLFLPMPLSQCLVLLIKISSSQFIKQLWWGRRERKEKKGQQLVTSISALGNINKHNIPQRSSLGVEGEAVSELVECSW